MSGTAVADPVLREATEEEVTKAATEVKRIHTTFELKDVDDDSRTFKGISAIWEQDLGDDIIHRGAFKETLVDWRKSPNAMPLLNSHNHFDIFSGLGQMLDAKEAKAGLETEWEVIDGPDGDRVLTRIRPSKRTGRAVVGSMSIGYVPLKFDFEDSDTARFGVVRHLRKLMLKEVSLVLFPMAPGALIDMASVKSMISQKRVSAEDLAGLQRLHADLEEALKLATDPTPSEAAATIVDAPDIHQLDRLKIQRLRLLAQRS
jgi:HK97 family phage prohead protease